ncbi:hypothetical protein APHAL10511_002227 [Amanita phalloides]|nr:hypothetical protein APHAL10511_002227 [Amanita phalloides]
MPTKLTTWRQASAYKEIPVPVPAGVQDGQAWRLVLSCDSSGRAANLKRKGTAGTGYSYAIDFGSDHFGSAPFPVLSMPIRFSARMPKGGVAKQEKIERVYVFPLPISLCEDGSDVPPDSGPAIAHWSNSPKTFIKVTEQTSFDLDKKIWDSGIGLSSWLVELATPSERELQGSAEADVDSNTSNTKPKRKLLGRLRKALLAGCVLELGAGTGIVALTIGALRAALPGADETSKSCIITTDLESAMPLLEHNINANAKSFADAKPEAMVLDWDDVAVPERIQNVSRQKGFDAIVMADVTYNTASFPSLVRTLSNLARLCDKPPLMLLGYKERDASERTLWEMLRREIDLALIPVGQIRGAGGEPIEIWIGQTIEPIHIDDRDT